MFIRIKGLYALHLVNLLLCRFYTLRERYITLLAVSAAPLRRLSEELISPGDPRGIKEGAESMHREKT